MNIFKLLCIKIKLYSQNFLNMLKLKRFQVIKYIYFIKNTNTECLKLYMFFFKFLMLKVYIIYKFT